MMAQIQENCSMDGYDDLLGTGNIKYIEKYKHCIMKKLSFRNIFLIYKILQKFSAKL